MLFPQGTLPAFDFSGRLLMDARHRLSLGPDGHGGSLKALIQSGALADMRNRGITTISYFQVDNPLVRPFDPLFLGLHEAAKSDMSTKVTRKAHDWEKVGNLCLEGGKVKVIEYSEMSEQFTTKKNLDGSRKFDAANLAIHLLDLDFVDRVAGQPAGLPLRRAEKAIAYVDEKGERVQPPTPNAVKLETFVFDVLPLARNPLLLEVDRAEEYSPVKNA
jgi:UDP-N-acetylglucosamine/UDP-N-acetylgalactosamine diphosphorylase